MKQFGLSKFQLLDSLVNFQSHIAITSEIAQKASPKRNIIKGKRPKNISNSFVPEENIQLEKQEKVVQSKGEQPKKNVQNKIKRNSSMIIPSINYYLDQIEIAKQHSLQSKKEIARMLLNVGQYVSQVKHDNKGKSSSWVSAKINGSSDNKFKPIEIFDSEEGSRIMVSNKSVKVSQNEFIRSRSCISEASTTRNIGEHDSGLDLSRILKIFYSKLELLKKLWQNEYRLEKFIKLKTILKPELNSILFPEEEIKTFHLSFQYFQKLFLGTKVINGEPHTQIIASQIRDVIESINKILEQQKFQELTELKQSIKSSSKTVKQLERNEVVQKFAIKKDYTYLSFQSLLMSSETKDKNLEKIELQLGPLKRVSNENRKMSLMINDTIHNLRQE